MAYYDEEVLFTLANAASVAIKIDHNTLKISRGKFARVCGEIDLTKLVVGRVCVEGKWYTIEYEGLHIICSHCGCYGHHSRNCSLPKSESVQRQTSSNTTEMVPHANLTVVVADSVNPNSSRESDPSIPTNPHGDWLVVT